MKVDQAMTHHPVTVSPDDRVGYAVQLMRRGHLRHLPVVVGGELVGILSDRDLLKITDVADGGLAAGQRFVREAMTVGVITVTRNERLGDAIDRMLQSRIDALVVTDAAGRVEGVITSTDLLAELRRVDGVTDVGAALGRRIDRE